MKKNFIAKYLVSGNQKRKCLKHFGLLITGSVEEINTRINSLTFKQLKNYVSVESII